MNFKHSREWREIGFFERLAIQQERNERRASPEMQAFRKAMRDTRKEVEQKQAKFSKLRAYLLAKRATA